MTSAPLPSPLPGRRRATVPAAIVQTVFAEAEGPLTSEEAWHLAQERHPGLGQATVYRVIKDLTAKAELRPVELPGHAGRRYEPSGHGHHHYFRCRACCRVLRLSACPGSLERLLPHGYVLDDHELLLTGRCDRCAPSVDDGPA